jgi:hypothetical protein
VQALTAEALGARAPTLQPVTQRGVDLAAHQLCHETQRTKMLRLEWLGARNNSVNAVSCQQLGTHLLFGAQEPEGTTT